MLDEGPEAIFRRRLGETTESLLLIDPTTQQIETLFEVATEIEPEAKLLLLAREEALKEAFADFLIASQTADLIVNETLEIHKTGSLPGNALIISESALSVIVTAGPNTAALTTTEGPFVSDSFAYFSDVWDDAESYSLRTPPLSKIQQSLRESIGPEVESDFNTIVQALDTARDNGVGLDEVTICLLVAAKNQELLYDISKWGEDVGIASKATFSRTKTELENLGIVDTEKVPIEVGRPRLRLKFAHERLQGTSAEELAGIALGLLS